MSNAEPMSVGRVPDEGGGTHIEPPLDPSWGDHDKLRWHAGVMFADTGVRVLVHKVGRKFSLQAMGHHWSTSLGATDYHAAWRLISGMSVGAEAAQSQSFEGQP